MFKPVFTEKSTKLARSGKYTFLVDDNMTKTDLKSQISKILGVTVMTIKTVKIGPESKRNFKGFRINKKIVKKAIITIKDGDKIDFFEEKKK